MPMRFFPLLCFVSLLWTGSAFDRPGRADDKPFVPYRLDQMTRFREIESSGGGTLTKAIEQTDRVTGQFRIGRRTYFLVQGEDWSIWERSSAAGVHEGTLEWNPETELLEVVDDAVLYKYPTFVGDVYPYDGSVIDPFNPQSYVKVASLNESVTTPAGTFDCVVYEFYEEQTVTNRTYIAPGIGIIKDVFYPDAENWNVLAFFDYLGRGAGADVDPETLPERQPKLERIAIPLDFGNEWTYRFSTLDRRGRATSRETSTNRIVGQMRVEGELWSLIDENGQGRWLRNAAEGVLSARSEFDDEYERPVIGSNRSLMFKYPVKQGETFEAFGGATVRIVSLDEPVEVPAGKYRCIIYEAEQEEGARTRVAINPDVGIVKMTNLSGRRAESVIELLRFTPAETTGDRSPSKATPSGKRSSD